MYLVESYGKRKMVAGDFYSMGIILVLWNPDQGGLDPDNGKETD